MTKPLVSIVIPTFNRSDVLERTLRAFLDQQCVLANIELVVIDDGSTDETPSILSRLAEADQRVKLFRQSNRGPGAARNAGIAVSKGSLILFAGDDVIPNSHLIDQHVVTHQRHSSEAIAVLGHITWSRELTLTPFMEWLESTGMQFGFSTIGDSDNVPAEMFYTSNISIPMDFLIQGDLFDERFTAACWEDIDLGLRLKKRGLRIIYRKDAIAYHLHRTDFRRFVRRTTTAGYFRAMLIEKHAITVKKRIFLVEFMKWIIGTQLRLLGWGRIRSLGYKWSLSWHEYLGMRSYIQMNGSAAAGGGAQVDHERPTAHGT